MLTANLTLDTDWSELMHVPSLFNPKCDKTKKADENLQSSYVLRQVYPITWRKELMGE